eukprot:g5099.t1
MSQRSNNDDHRLITKNYLIGQCANAVKLAVWWCATSPMIYGLSGRSDFAIGACRFSYNLALFIFSPLAGALMESGLRAKTNLVYTNWGRAVLLVFALPLAWFFFSSDLAGSLAYTNTTIMVVCLVAIFFLDGINVAFTAIVDIDMSGVDILCAEYKIDVDEKMRHGMNTIFQIVLDSSMIFFSPIVAIASYYLSRLLEHHLDDVHAGAYEGGGILGGISIVFLVATLVSAFCYGQIPVSSSSPSSDDGEDGTWRSKSTALWKKSAEGVAAVWANRPIFWRIGFLAIEQSLEDAMIAVMLAEFSLSSPAFGSHNTAIGNLWLSALIASGKIGGVIAAQLYSKCVAAPRKSSDYVPLFVSVFLGGLSVMLMPIARLLPKIPGMILVFVSAFLFFFFSTPPKIGFQTLMQGLVVRTSKAATIFGAIGPIVMVTDSLVIFLMTIGFEAFKRHYGDEDGFAYALWTMASIYLLHGCFEVFLGPALVLSSMDEGNADDAYTILDESGVAVNRRTPKEDMRTPRMNFHDPRSPWMGKKKGRAVDEENGELDDVSDKESDDDGDASAEAKRFTRAFSK